MFVAAVVLGSLAAGCFFPSSGRLVTRQQAGQMQRIEYGTVEKVSRVIVEGQHGQIGTYGGVLTGVAATGGVGHGVGTDLARTGGDLGKSVGDRRCGQPDNWWGSRCDCGQSTRGGTHDSPERRSDGGHCPRARSSAVRGGRPRQDYVGWHPRPGGPRRNSRQELLIRLNRRSGPDRRRGPVRKVRRSPDCA